MANPTPSDSSPPAPVPSVRQPNKQAESPETTGSPRKRPLVLGPLLLILCIAVVAVAGVNVYQDALHKKRFEIVHLIEKKGLNLEEPQVKAIYVEASMTNWLPALDRLLGSLRQIPIKGLEIIEALPANPEKGGYIEYIQRHDLPFDEQEAMEWQARSLRKPANP